MTGWENGVGTFVVNTQSFTRGALDLVGYAPHKFSASSGTINSLGTKSGANNADVNITLSGGVISVKPAGAGYPNGPYNLTVECIDAELNSVSVPVNIATEADTYTFATDAEFAGIIAVGVTTLSGKTAKGLPGDYAWNNSNLDARTFTSMFTVTSHYDSNRMRWTLMDLGSSTQAKMSASTNITLTGIDFYANFDRTLHSVTNCALRIGGIVGDITFSNNNCYGNLTTIGPGRSFRGFLGVDGNVKVNGSFIIEDNKFIGVKRGLNVGTANGDADSLGHIEIRRNEFVDIGTDGIILLGALDDNLVEDNYMHDFYYDEWIVQLNDGAYLTKASLTGAVNSTKFLFHCKNHWEKPTPGETETVYAQGSALKIYRDSLGKIHCDIDDTGGSQVVSLVSTNAVLGVVSDVIISVDTDGSGYLYIKQQLADGSGVWVQEDVETYSGQTLDLTTGTVSIGATATGTEPLDGEIERVGVWQGIAPNITIPTVRDNFAGAFNERVEPSITAAAYGTPIVSFYGYNTVWNAGANSGSGGNFTKAAGRFDNSHGDFIQGIPGAIRTIKRWVVRRNVSIAGRSDGSPFEYKRFQGYLFEDIADPEVQYNQEDYEIYDNFIGTYNTTHGISVYNAVRAKIYNNTIAYNPDWKLPGGSVPTIHLLSQWGGTGSGSIVNDNVLPAAVDIASGFGTETNNIISNDLTAGANAWSNLFDGSFNITTKAEAIAAFTAKTGGPLLAADPDVGAIGTAYTDWDLQTSTTRYAGVSDVTVPVYASCSPADDATGVAITTDIEITFTEANTLSLGSSKTFTVYDVTNTANEQVFNTTDDLGSGPGKISISGNVVKLEMTGDLTNSVEYATKWVAGAVKDGDGNEVAANTSNTLASFTTAAAALSALVDDDFTTNTNTYPYWTETNGTKAYDGTDDELDYTVGLTNNFRGTSLDISDVATISVGTNYDITMVLSNDCGALQVEGIVGTVVETGSNLVACLPRLGTGEQNITVTGTFTASATGNFVTARIRGEAGASDQLFTIHSILIEAA